MSTDGVPSATRVSVPRSMSRGGWNLGGALRRGQNTGIRILSKSRPAIRRIGARTGSRSGPWYGPGRLGLGS